MKATHSPTARDLDLKPGRKIASWTVLSVESRRALCQCVCGEVRFVSLADLISGGTQSCGCSLGPELRRASREAAEARRRRRDRDWRPQR